MVTLLAVIVTAVWTPAAQAEELQLANSYSLGNDFSRNSSNFHPQGLGIDESTGELLYMQQSTNTIYRSNLSGSPTGNRSVGYHHTTSVAADATNYYFSDYTSNNSGLDLFVIGKGGGSASAFSSDVAGYGGYPIDVRNGVLYRTETSNNYNWSNLNQIRISPMSNPDSITTSYSIDTNGIGDIAVDVDGNYLWVLEYQGAASIRQFNLSTGQLIEVFPLALDGDTAGLTYFNGQLFHWDWNTGSSQLRVYNIVSTADSDGDGIPDHLD
ncbi:MAG TPA: hypothetical protein DIU15_09745, partial [Deltaproteobacteria bacterium]|nr:hypothetical protein [Deltaproteobacteria bacterium]